MEKALEKRTFITGTTGDVGARKVASRRFAIALQYAAGAVLGLLLDVAFILFVLWGTTPSRRAIEPNKSVKLDQTEFSYPSHVVLQQAARSNGELLRNAEVLTRRDAMRSGLSANRFGFPLHQVDRTVEAIFHSYAQATVPTCDDDMQNSSLAKK